jgi:phosphoribosylformylglycinamidine synthase
MGILNSAHDISEGGLAIALAESCFTPAGPTGVHIYSLSGKIREDSLLFGESQSRAITSLDRKDIRTLERIASKYKVPMEIIGKVGGDKFCIKEFIDIPISRAYEPWASGFEKIVKQ